MGVDISDTEKIVARVERYLKAIEAKNKDINAFLHVSAADARMHAAVVQKKMDDGTAGALAGLVFGVKACINVKGMITNCASKTLANYVAPYDADVIATIKAEDGIIIGMCNMDEFAQGSSGQHSAYGPTVNPICPERISGGTSSGSAAAIAAGMCDVALGSDTGGSVRCPASHCGVVGVKPSYGRVSRYGLIDSAMSLDQIGVLAADVSTVSRVLQVISGVSANDPTTVDVAVAQYDLTPPRQLRIGVPTDLLDMCLHPEVKGLILQTIEKYATANGHTVHHIAIAHVKLAIQAYYPIVYTEFFSGTRKFDGRKYGHIIEQTCGEEVLRRISGGRIISMAEHGGRYYRKALKAMQLIREAFDSAFENVDVIMLPTMPDIPWKADSIPDPRSEYAADAFTIPANLAGVCAGVVPVGLIENCPVGLQVMAPAFREELLLSTLLSLETMKR